MEARDNADRHRQRQQKLKEQVDARVAAATEQKGILIVFTGNGKGKSTAAFGTATRAVGHGKTVGVAQFIKGQWDNGEYNTLHPLGVEFHIMGTGFYLGDAKPGSGHSGRDSGLAGGQANAGRPGL
ncbi:cob(I)yrinic acid a,c-diamide adenosyltransferase [Salmonella enterica subsp. enterica serovar Sanjuan]|uniref:corrinoid adenosyltransferase n=1 Tax=Salmonella enterica subsp. enterica serovar Sanjuan TaxID=1160765 RepID=A0A447NYG6_SALET|nr:cob(I)yrinic acid a,c-diamide adenosyltransferase [Salmonella enterica subsp. enterica serovar Sanjuan]